MQKEESNLDHEPFTEKEAEAATRLGSILTALSDALTALGANQDDILKIVVGIGVRQEKRIEDIDKKLTTLLERSVH